MKKKSVLGKVLVFGAMLCLLLALVVPAVTSAQGTTGTGTTGACSNLTNGGLDGVISCIIGILNNVVILLISGAVVFIVYGAFEMIQSEEKRDAGKQRIYHGIIGLFVMVSIWGLVNILQATFSLTGTAITPPVLVVPATP